MLSWMRLVRLTGVLLAEDSRCQHGLLQQNMLEHLNEDLSVTQTHR